MSPSVTALAVVSGVVLLACSMVVRTLLARRAIRRRLESLAVRLGAGQSLPGRGAPGVALAHLERAAGHAQETVTGALTSGALLARALDAVSQGVLVCDEKGQVVYRNSHLCRLIGNPGSGPLVAGIVEEMTSATGHDQVLSRRLGLPGPPQIALRVDTTPVDDGQRTVGVVAVVRDVSSDHEALETRRDFLADARDELSLPASTIRTLAEVLVDQEPGPVTRQLAGRIHTQAAALAQVVEDLILLHRAEVEPPSATRPVPVGVVVDQALARVRAEADQREVSVEIASGPEGPPEMSVAGDRGQLVAALSHLVRAAVQGSPDGSRVHVRQALTDRFAEIRVGDNGSGPAARAGMELDLPSGAGGAGVGLNIAKKVAESHGGTVDVCSPEDGGLALVLRLPVITPVTVVEA